MIMCYAPPRAGPKGKQGFKQGMIIPLLCKHCKHLPHLKFLFVCLFDHCEAFEPCSIRHMTPTSLLVCVEGMWNMWDMHHCCSTRSTHPGLRWPATRLYQEGNCRRWLVRYTHANFSAGLLCSGRVTGPVLNLASRESEYSATVELVRHHSRCAMECLCAME